MNYLILATGQGFKYGRRITKEIRLLGEKAYLYRCFSLDLAFRNHPEWNPNNLIIHSRAANPNAEWMNRLVELEEQEYRVVNNTSCLRTTSDKWASVRELREIGNIPKTKLIQKSNFSFEDIDDYFFTTWESYPLVIKPRISQGGGQFVFKLEENDLNGRENFLSAINQVPGRYVIVQDYIEYDSLIRVFCINGRALPYGTIDTPTRNRWKVSVCLNKKQRGIRLNEELKLFAERIQQRIGGEINFIDIFDAPNGLVLSEVNTACNLTIHERLTGMNIAKKIAEYLVSLGG